MTDRLYVPRATTMPDADVRGFVEATATAHLVTVGDDGTPQATFLPVLWREDDTVVGHLARANPHVARIVDGGAALLVVGGADAYVSPGWYATKREHGRVVPTWNYSTVQLRGTVRLVEDVDWLRAHVTALTDRHERDRHERDRTEPWAVTDAPERYVAGQLRAIVGIEVTVTSVEAKDKLSQNRSEADQDGVIAGLGDHPVAEAMRVGRARR